MAPTQTPMRVFRFRLFRLVAIAGVCATATLAAGCDNWISSSSNSYWYCWDEGAKKPHHLGHHVSGDHVCNDNELKGTRFSPR